MAGTLDEGRTRLLGRPFVAGAARWGVVAWSAIGILLLGFIVFRYILYPIRIIFPPLVVALVLVYLLNPIVSWLAGRGLPRLAAALVTYLVFLSLLGVGLRFLIPVVADQVQAFARSVPALLARAQRFATDAAGNVGFELNTQGLLNPESQQQALDFLGRLLSFTRGLFHVALILVLGPFLAFYLLVDLPKLQRGVEAFIPARRRPEIASLLQRLGRAVGGFFRGQLLVALFVGVASSFALYVVGLPYWAMVGMVTGLFNLIPLIGPFIGGIIAGFVAFTTTTSGEGLLRLEPGWPLAIGAAIGLVIVQQVDNHIISPNIVARTVKLHPVTVMLALLAGGTLLGVWGMLLAVPVLASAKVLILHAWDTRMTWPPAERVGSAAAAPGPSPPASTGAGSVVPVASEPAVAPRAAGSSGRPWMAGAGRAVTGWVRRRAARWRGARRTPTDEIPPQPERTGPGA